MQALSTYPKVNNPNMSSTLSLLAKREEDLQQYICFDFFFFLVTNIDNIDFDLEMENYAYVNSHSLGYRKVECIHTLNDEKKNILSPLSIPRTLKQIPQ